MIVYVDIDGVLADYDRAYEEVRMGMPETKYPQSLPGFFTGLHPIQDAVTSFQVLSQHHDTYILTAPSNRNPLSYTEKRLWVEEHLGFDATEKLIICSNKGLLKGDILIDDNIDGKGQENFEGKLIKFDRRIKGAWQQIIQQLCG
ncbi:5' nucleotidase, NT5C type [Kangiella taiwanensis]|uniref:Uncharacterized protein n=1 Tax=Kangiella taiwanensis TaxID=1079179 RepID=A0ABP8I8G3_9GAMM|nr:hypothetical protein [Kangiella taiwanensis]RDX37701.1 hypothetical protein DZA50_01620 [Kangiella sp. HD9-110m-PIT-SAG07]